MKGCQLVNALVFNRASAPLMVPVLIEYVESVADGHYVTIRVIIRSVKVWSHKRLLGIRGKVYVGDDYAVLRVKRSKPGGLNRVGGGTQRENQPRDKT